MAKGSTNKAIARELGISEETVKVHVHRVFQKSGIHTRAKLAVKILSEVKKLLLALPPREGSQEQCTKAGALK
jgi:ATP/maltotriose-dependent transcriptional regulator MalT